MEALVNGTLFALVIPLGMLALLLLALEWGYRRGRRAVALHDVASSAQIGAVQGAILGMLGLLLAFSFAAAGGRFLERQDLIVAEANAIGTAWLRADLIGEPARSELRSALRDYTAHRIAARSRFQAQVIDADAAEIERLHARIWKSALAGVAARPEVVLALLNPVNEVIDLHSTRLFAAQKHLPSLVLGLLIASSLLALGVIGYGCGVGGRRSAAMTVPLAIVIGVALWVTIDLDYPRRGLLQLSDAPLEALRLESPAPHR
jgi:hypothetical protein